MSNENRDWVVSMKQKCEGLQKLNKDKHVQSDRRIRCCCFTVVIQRGKGVKVKSGVLPELPVRPERKSVMICILYNTKFLRFEISKHQCSCSYFLLILLCSAS
jgi:hypothetical protein